MHVRRSLKYRASPRITGLSWVMSLLYLGFGLLQSGTFFMSYNLQDLCFVLFLHLVSYERGQLLGITRSYLKGCRMHQLWPTQQRAHHGHQFASAVVRVHDILCLGQNFDPHEWTRACTHACMLNHFSHVWLFANLWTVAHWLLCPWDSPGKNTGVGCHALFQGIFLNQETLSPALAGRFFTTSATCEAPSEHLTIHLSRVYVSNWIDLFELFLYEK